MGEWSTISALHRAIRRWRWKVIAFLAEFQFVKRIGCKAADLYRFPGNLPRRCAAQFSSPLASAHASRSGQILRCVTIAGCRSGRRTRATGGGGGDRAGTRNRTYQLCIRNIDVFYIAALNCYTICYTIGRGFLAGVPQFDAETGIDQDEVGGRFYCPNAACPGRYRVLSGQTAFWGLNRSVANDPLQTSTVTTHRLGT